MSIGLVADEGSVFIEIEATEGVYAPESAGAKAIEVLSDGLEFTPTKELLDRSNRTSTVEKVVSRVGQKSMAGSIPTEFKAGSTEGAAPETSPLYEALLGGKAEYTATTTETEGHTTTSLFVSPLDAAKYKKGYVVKIKEYDQDPQNEDHVSPIKEIIPSVVPAVAASVFVSSFFVAGGGGNNNSFTLTADTAGVAGNSISIAGNGVDTVDDLVAAWNLANTANTVSIDPSNAEIPTGGTTFNLEGGADSTIGSAGGSYNSESASTSGVNFNNNGSQHLEFGFYFDVPADAVTIDGSLTFKYKMDGVSGNTGLIGVYINDVVGAFGSELAGANEQLIGTIDAATLTGGGGINTATVTITGSDFTDVGVGNINLQGGRGGISIKAPAFEDGLLSSLNLQILNTDLTGGNPENFAQSYGEYDDVTGNVGFSSKSGTSAFQLTFEIVGSPAELILLVPYFQAFTGGVEIAAGVTYYHQSGQPTLSVTNYLGGEIREKAIGMRAVSAEMSNFATGQLPQTSFSLEGLDYDRAVGTPLFSPEFDTSLPPVVLCSKIYQDDLELTVNNVSLSMANTLGFLTSTASCSGKISSRITEFVTNFTCNPYMEDDEVGQFEKFNKNDGYSLFGSSQNYGATDNEKLEVVAFYCPNCRTTEIATGDEDGILTDAISGQAYRDAGNDTVFISFI